MKLDRLVSIIMILLDKKRIGAAELAELFEVSPRTIYRDIDTINMAGIPVCSTCGVGGGFEIMQKYKLDKNVFSADDITSILIGLRSLSNTMHGNELIGAIAKIKSFIPTENAKDIEIRTNQIYVDLSPWTFNRNVMTNLELIKKALQEDKLLAFEYSAHHANKTSRTVEPYQLVLKNSHWYLQSYCLKRSDYRLFKLSRISNLNIQDETFLPRNYEKPILEFFDILETLQTKIKLRIHQDVVDSVLDYCAIEDFNSDGSEHFIIDFPFIENDYYFDVLLSFGNKCECLSPPDIRAKLKDKIENLYLLYQD